MVNDAPERREPQYLHGAGADEQARLEKLAEMLGGADFLPKLTPGMHLVEVGCGTGAIARRVAARVTPGTVTAVDRQKEQIDTARRLAAARGVQNVDFHIGEADALDFPDGACDAAYCRFLLEHVSDPTRVVSEIARLVRPGGWVCAYEWDNALESIYPECPAHSQTWDAIYRWQLQQGGDPWIARKLYQVFLQAGFADVRAEARVWTVTAAERENLKLFVDGAREIIRQTRDGILREGIISTDTLAQVDEEYARLLQSPETYIAEGFCRAVGHKNP